MIDPCLGAWLLQPEHDSYAFADLLARHLGEAEAKQPPAGSEAKKPDVLAPPPKQHHAKPLFKDLVGYCGLAGGF